MNLHICHKHYLLHLVKNRYCNRFWESSPEVQFKCSGKVHFGQSFYELGSILSSS